MYNFKIDREVILITVRQNSNILCHISEGLKNVSTLMYASIRLQAYIKVDMKAPINSNNLVIINI
jgi:hypothetical protein